MRLDVFLTKNRYFESREKAQFAIEQGIIEVQGKLCRKAAFDVSGEELIRIVEEPLKFVSLGGLKLEKALLDFKIHFSNDDRILDIGASTGGFTDCALQAGAHKVYAVDVGSGQLHSKFRNHPHVISYENKDIRNLNLDEIDNQQVDYIVMDISFVSLTLILPFIAQFLKSTGKIIALVKPQFEMTEKHRFRNGIIKDASVHKQVLQKVIRSAEENGFYLLNQTEAPVVSEKKNKEFLILLGKK